MCSSGRDFLSGVEINLKGSKAVPRKQAMKVLRLSEEREPSWSFSLI